MWFESGKQTPNSSEADTSPYTILGVAAGATAAEIERAYKDKAKLVHPDAGGSAEQFMVLKDAHDSLLGEVERAAKLSSDTPPETTSPETDREAASVDTTPHEAPTMFRAEADYNEKLWVDTVPFTEVIKYRLLNAFARAEGVPEPYPEANTETILECALRVREANLESKKAAVAELKTELYGHSHD